MELLIGSFVLVCVAFLTINRLFIYQKLIFKEKMVRINLVITVDLLILARYRNLTVKLKFLSLLLFIHRSPTLNKSDSYRKNVLEKERRS